MMGMSHFMLQDSLELTALDGAENLRRNKMIDNKITNFRSKMNNARSQFRLAHGAMRRLRRRMTYYWKNEKSYTDNFENEIRQINCKYLQAAQASIKFLIIK